MQAAKEKNLFIFQQCVSSHVPNIQWLTGSFTAIEHMRFFCIVFITGDESKKKIAFFYCFEGITNSWSVKIFYLYGKNH